MLKDLLVLLCCEFKMGISGLLFSPGVFQSEAVDVVGYCGMHPTSLLG